MSGCADVAYHDSRALYHRNGMHPSEHPPPHSNRSARRERDRELRLFVAIYPPPGIVEQMLAAGRAYLDEHAEALADLAVHLVPPEQVHLTVHFLGGVPLRRLDETLDSIDRAKKGLGAFTLCPDEVIQLPVARANARPRLIAIRTDSPADLLELHRRTVGRLARSPRADSADRFLPHLSLARFRRSGPHGMHAKRPWRPPVAWQPRLQPFAVTEFHLVKSILRSEGAQHVAIAKWPLVGR